MPSEIFWAGFTWIVLGIFLVAEYIGLRSKKPYTRYIRKWLGIDPPHKGIKWVFFSFIGLWAIFAIWFPIHIACAWPWETSC